MSDSDLPTLMELVAFRESGFPDLRVYLASCAINPKPEMPASDGSKSNLKDLAGSTAPDPQALGLDWFYFQKCLSARRGEKELAYFCLTNKHAFPKDSASSTEASPSGRHKEALSGAETSEFYGKKRKCC